jgi:hypothetical protein
MSTASHISEEFQRVLARPTGGISGLVDDLLAVCREHSLQLDWQAGRCRVRPSGSEWEEVIDLPLRKSVFRAILARVAALCNERTPNSVSPYGGQGEFSVDGNPPAAFQVAFLNTPTEQKLALTIAPRSNAAAPHSNSGVSMKRARRPEVFDRKAMVERFVSQGLARSMAEPLTSDFKLVVPILIRELGVERINEILQHTTAELHLAERAFWPELTRYIVQWAEDELADYIRRKQGHGPSDPAAEGTS